MTRSKTQNLFSSQFASPALIMSNAAAAELDSCFNTARQSNLSPSCFLMQFTHSPALDTLSQRHTGGGGGESPSHIYSMYWVLQEMRMHYTFSDDKQSYRNVVSHDSLNKLKVLNGEGRILIGFDSISLGFLSLALSFFLRLPISNLSPLPAIA